METLQIEDTHRVVLRNTYTLLALTLLCSTITCGLGMLLNLDSITGIILSLIGFGILCFMVISDAANKPSGLPLTFLFTGIEGLAIAPTIDHFFTIPNGELIVLQALLGTCLLFFCLSLYVIKCKKDFSFLRGFLFVALIGILILLIGSLIASLIFKNSFDFSIASVGISYAVILIMSGYMLLDTSDIIHGHQTNYIIACINIYLNVINIFLSLLNILSNTDR